MLFSGGMSMKLKTTASLGVACMGWADAGTAITVIVTYGATHHWKTSHLSRRRNVKSMGVLPPLYTSA
jgi:hypothetical protein